jgi:phosphoserine phosphatase
MTQPAHDHVATLVSRPAAAALDADALTRARSLLPFPGEPSWLDPTSAADIPCRPDPADDLRALAAAVRSALDPRPVDVVVQPAAGRRKSLFIADMDSTMIGQECIDELAAEVGLKEHVAAITERAMRGDIAFEPALRERVALLAGLPVDVVERVLAERIRLTPGARELVGTLRTNGAYTCLVSGGFTLFADRIGAMIGFHEVRANRLIVDDGRFSGTVAEPILGREAKRETLAELAAQRALALDATMAVGDGANDLAMLTAAGLGIAYHAKPKVAAAAAARIDHGDLTALLFVQGYRREDFVGADSG